MSVGSRHDAYMQAAIELARIGMQKNKGGPFGAIIVRNDQIISYGQNEVTSQNDPTAHAEIVAIRAACKNLNSFNLEDCEIYSSCEPCPMCLSAIYWAHIEKIYYAATHEDAAAIEFADNLIYQELSKPLSNRQIPYQQLLRDEALKVFQEWQSKPNKTAY